MNYGIKLMMDIFGWVLRTSWQAAALAGLILVAQWILRKRLSPGWCYGMWLLVVVRLLMPIQPHTAFSVFNISNHVAVIPPANLPPVTIADNHFIAEEISHIPASLPERIELPQIESKIVTQVQDKDVIQKTKIVNPITWRQLAFIGWLIGVVLLTARLFISNIRLRSRLHQYQPVTNARAQHLFNDCRTAFSIKQAIKLIESEEVESPAVYGFWRKCLLLPDGAFELFSTEELRCIFLHELAHIKRGDLAVNWLVAVLQILHWFNPILWLAWARMRADRELATDSLALRYIRDEDRVSYGETILKVVAGLTSQRALPGLVGIVENKAQLARRLLAIARPRQSWKWAACILTIILAGIGLTAAQTEKDAFKSPRPTLTGHVETSSGQPARATVLIYTAGPKLGTSFFCPSCYADCRKKATTDDKGNFKIESLDPELRFRLLVVGGNFQPKFVEKVDPTNSPIKVVLKSQSTNGIPPQNMVHGRIIDTNGAPIAGAVIETSGYKTIDGQGGWGNVKDIDPLAVSDSQGRFVIMAHRVFYTLDINVTANGFAQKKFLGVAGGNQEHDLVLSVGATVMGRVLYHGQPVTNVSIGVVSVRRDMENFVGNFDVTTDADGHFVFLNLPPGISYYIFGSMSTLKTMGCIPSRQIEVGADGSTTGVGNLMVEPAYRISGRLVLNDRAPFPKKVRLLVDRENAWDSMQIELDKEGNFSMNGIPPGVINLSADVSGYHPSVRNGSLDTLNPFGLVGRVDHDITNLTYLMEKGPRLQSHFDQGENYLDEPKNNPLRGSEWKPTRALQRELTGRVTNSKTGQLIAHFHVTPGREPHYLPDSIDWNPLQSVEGSNGLYTININKHGTQPFLKIEASGYAPVSSPPLAADATNWDASLAPGGEVVGKVILPDGHPARGVQVMLVAPHSGNFGNLELQKDGKLVAYQYEKALKKTDDKGGFSFAPQLGMESVAASAPEGFALVSVAALSTNRYIKLEPWGKIKGKFLRGGKAVTNETLDLRFADETFFKNAANKGNVTAAQLTLPTFFALRESIHTDQNGEFQFDHVPPTCCSISSRIPMGNQSWQEKKLESFMVKPGEVTTISVSSPESFTQISGNGGFSNNGGDTTPPVKYILNGTVFLPNGMPAADAQVGLKLPTQELSIGDGELVAGPLNDSVARTDENGHFKVPMRDSATMLFAASDTGFAKIDPDSWSNGMHITLQRWGKVAGVLHINDKLGGNQLIRLGEKMNEGFFKGTHYAQQSTTDDKGHFFFAHVPVGDLELSRRITFSGPSGNGWRNEYPKPVSIQEGETTNVTWGGDGRPVIGKCVMVTGSELPEGARRLINISTPQPKFPGSTNGNLSFREMSAWRRSEAGKTAMKNFRFYTADLAEDGTFHIDDVPPGEYSVSVQFLSQYFNSGSGPENIKFLVPSIKIATIPAHSDANEYKPFDLGVISLTVSNRAALPPERDLKVGEDFPSLQTKTLDGRPLTLDAFKGKYVLLDIRLMLNDSRSDYIRSVYSAFQHDNRFVIVTLTQDADDVFVKSLAKNGFKNWIQGDLDLSALMTKWGVRFSNFPMVYLIDPQGKIIGASLLGDEIKSSVAMALAKK